MNTMQIANTIRDQIGGRALFMIGASQLVADHDSLRFRFKMCPKANVITIRLDADDTYTVEFHKVRGLNSKLAHSVSGVYCDQLHATIEAFTGLATRL
jgi:hypothetical protein